MSSELQRVSERWFQAWLDKDAATVERLSAEDYICIAPSGMTMDREAILKAIRAPGYKLDRGTRTEVVVRLLGRDAGVVRHRYQGAGSFDGASFTDDHRVAETLRSCISGGSARDQVGLSTPRVLRGDVASGGMSPSATHARARLLDRAVGRDAGRAARRYSYDRIGARWLCRPRALAGCRRRRGEQPLLLRPERTTFDALYQPSSAKSGSACSSSQDAIAAAPRLLIDNNNRRDVEGVLAGYTEDAIWLSPDQPVVRGRQDFRPRYESLFRDNKLEYTAEITEARADGSLGYAWGKIRGMSTPLDGGPARPVEDTFLAITRCESGRWLVSRLVWSHAKH